MKRTLYRNFKKWTNTTDFYLAPSQKWKMPVKSFHYYFLLFNELTIESAVERCAETSHDCKNRSKNQVWDNFFQIKTDSKFEFKIYFMGWDITKIVIELHLHLHLDPSPPTITENKNAISERSVSTPSFHTPLINSEPKTIPNACLHVYKPPFT